MKLDITIKDATIEDVRKVTSLFTQPEAVEVAAPTPTPVAVTEMPTPTPTPVAVTETEVDADGLPWDERIHSSNKAKNADGCWRKVRGLTEDVRKAVEAELRTSNITNNLPADAQPITTPVAVTEPPPSVPTPPVPEVQVPDKETITFRQLLDLFQRLIFEKKVEPSYAATLVSDLNADYHMNFRSFADLQNDPIMIGHAYRQMLAKAA